MKLDNDIELLETVLEMKCAELLQGLQPGLSTAYMDRILTDTLVCYDLIKKIYGWKNGVSKEHRPFAEKYSFHPCGNFIPLEDATELQQQMEKDGYWDYRFFPLMRNYDGEYLLIDIEESSPTYGFLYIYSLPLLIAPPQTIYDNFTSFVESLSHCYSSKGYIYKRRTHELEVNHQFEKIFSKQINPQSEYWRGD